MDFGFVLVIFSYCSHFIHLFEMVSAGTTNFELIQDREKVEKLAVQYAKHKNSWRGAATKPIAMLRKNICGQTAELKVAFCYKFLPMAYMGFKFVTWNENDLICAASTFWISHPHDHGADSFALEMYPCPDIKYRDLTTDEDVIIPDKYYVSEGKKRDSAIVFFQKDKNDRNDKIYPKKYINNIVFEELVSAKAEYEHKMLEIKMTENIHPTEEIIRYAAVQMIGEPYTKFRESFHSINICRLPKSHKIFLCREALKASSLTEIGPLELEAYDQYRCKKHQIHSHFNDFEFFYLVGQWRPPKKLHFHLLLCPLEIRKHEQKFIESFRYLFSNLNLFSMTLLTRDNHWDTRFKRDRIFSDVDYHTLVRDSRRVRKMIYPSASERKQELLKLQRNDLQEFEKESYWILTSVQTPITMAKTGRVSWNEAPHLQTPILITRKEPLVEDILLSYSEIKAMKFAYRRFMKTYWSLDICQLPHKLKTALCDNILKQSPFEYYPSSDVEEQSNESSHSVEIDLQGTYKVHASDRDVHRRCSRREVNLRLREIESLKAKYFSMWQCPKAEITGGYVTTYHIAKYHLKNALMLFKTSDIYKNDDIIFPEAVATEIDRMALAWIVLDDMRAH